MQFEETSAEKLSSLPFAHPKPCKPSMLYELDTAAVMPGNKDTLRRDTKINFVPHVLFFLSSPRLPLALGEDVPLFAAGAQGREVGVHSSFFRRETRGRRLCLPHASSCCRAPHVAVATTATLLLVLPILRPCLIMLTKFQHKITRKLSCDVVDAIGRARTKLAVAEVQAVPANLGVAPKTHQGGAYGVPT